MSIHLSALYLNYSGERNEDWKLIELFYLRTSFQARDDPEVDKNCQQRLCDSFGLTELPWWPDVKMWHRARKEAVLLHTARNPALFWEPGLHFVWSWVWPLDSPDRHRPYLAFPRQEASHPVGKEKGEPEMGKKNGACPMLTVADSLACGHVPGRLSDRTGTERSMYGDQTGVGLISHNFSKN